MRLRRSQTAAALGCLITLVMISGCPLELPEGLDLEGALGERPPPSEEPADRPAQGSEERVRLRARHRLGVPLHPGVGANGVSGRLPDGALVEVLGRAEEGRWIHVRGAGQEGWITRRYLASPEAPGAPARPPPSPPTSARPHEAGAHPFSSPAACEDWLAAHPRPAPGRALRVGTWNLRWFPYGHMPGRGDGPQTDRRWLGCAIASLEVDALAVQEVVLDQAGRAALAELLAELDRRTGGRWRSELDTCPRDGRQHVGFLYDGARLRKRGVRLYPELNPAGGACATRLRPGLALEVEGPDGAPISLLSVHLDSGVAARDHGHRQEGYALLADRLGAPGARLIVLGDLNVMGCTECGPPIRAEQEQGALASACASRGVRLPSMDHPCTELSSHGAGALDRILLSPGLLPALRGGRIEVGGFCASSGCGSGVRRGGAYRLLSDHCPLVAELSL